MVMSDISQYEPRPQNKNITRKGIGISGGSDMPGGGQRGLVAPQNTFLESVMKRVSAA